MHAVPQTSLSHGAAFHPIRKSLTSLTRLARVKCYKKPLDLQFLQEQSDTIGILPRQLR